MDRSALEALDPQALRSVANGMDGLVDRLREGVQEHQRLWRAVAEGWRGDGADAAKADAEARRAKLEGVVRGIDNLRRVGDGAAEVLCAAKARVLAKAEQIQGHGWSVGENWQVGDEWSLGPGQRPGGRGALVAQLELERLQRELRQALDEFDAADADCADQISRCVDLIVAGDGDEVVPLPAGADRATRLPPAAVSVGQVRYGGIEVWPGGQAACAGYIDRALDAMGVTDPAARENWRRGMLVVAARESGYNRSLVNRWDSNAWGARMPDGAPANSSRGMFQTIPSAFAAHHQAGTSLSIYDPVANAAAAMNYVRARYHVSPDGHDLAAKVQQADPNRAPRGY